MSHIKINNKLFLCNQLFMSNTNNFASNSSTSLKPTIKRKKRLLSSATRSVKPEINETTAIVPQKKRKRKLNIPTLDKPLIERTSSTSPPPPTTATLFPSSLQQQQPAIPMPTPAKRSIRAASEAIEKREKQRKTKETKPPSPPKPTLPNPEKAPVLKRKRKLNTQKIFIPKSSSQEFEENGDDSYDKYLESSNTTPIITTNGIANKSTFTIPSTDEAKPAIVIGVPTKKRKLGRTTTATRSIIKKSEMTDNTTATATTTVISATEPAEEDSNIKASKLDLSKHSILPNQSYVAHLPQTYNNRRRRSTTASTATSVSSTGDNISMTSHNDMDTASDVMTNMENYTTKSSPTIFYDAISDFEDMNLDDNDDESLNIANEETMIECSDSGNIEKEKLSQQPNGSFWGSILKPFKH